MPRDLCLDDLGRMGQEDFTALLGDVFEHSPWVVERAWRARPFASVDDLHAAMVEAVQTSAMAQKLELLRAHPRLAGKAARQGALTEYSTAEQKGAGLADLSPTEARRLDALNHAYSERFGFPFIIAVKNHSKAGIFAALERRLQNTPAEELATALNEVGQIARHRLNALLGPDSGEGERQTPTRGRGD